MAAPLRKRVKRAIRSIAVRVAVHLLSWLPLRPALALGTLVGRVTWLVAHADRRLMLEHLALAFPDRSERERRAIAKASLVHLGQLAMEAVAIRSYRRHLEEYVSFAPGSEDVVRRAIARGRGLIVAAGHIGNWELLAQRMAVIAQPNGVIARKNADPKLNRMVERFRAEGRCKTLWRDDPATGRELIKLFRRGGTLGILIDQDTKVQGVFVPFFGRPAFTPRAVGDLALRFGATVVVGTSRRRGPRPGDGHELEFVELPYDAAPADREAEVERITAAAAALQESFIRGHPSEWVWMHRRWKTSPPTEYYLARPVPKSRELSET
jgi:Kdo2-lipid IVA lauroyltransferase/acyltransferase